MNDQPDEPAPESAGRLIVMSGPAGAGKTTVAALLADQFSPSVHLYTDTFFHYVRRGYIQPFLPASQRQNEIVVDAYSAAAVTYAAGGYQVVIDGVIAPWALERLARQAGRGRAPLHYVVLRPPLEVVLSRGMARGGTELTEEGPLRQVYAAFRDLGSLAAHVIDSSTDPPDVTAQCVLEGLAAGRFLVAPTA